MRLSDYLYEEAGGLWEEAANKPFVREMALGSLKMENYRWYMLQDYLYLQDYIGILQRALALSKEEALSDFLRDALVQTRYETERVHLPAMKQIGISDQEIQSTKQLELITDYAAYMNGQLGEGDLTAGLTALLQCSWVYACLGQRLTDRFEKEIERSPYRSWFEAYDSPSYRKANQAWIDMLNLRTQGISPERTRKLGRIFVTCVSFENRFWDCLYAYGRAGGEKDR